MERAADVPPQIASKAAHAPRGRAGTIDRVVGGLLAAMCLTVLLLAARIEPSPFGHGTHTQLGLPACGWVQMFHKPCMTCGMTTAFAHAARLDLWASFKTQPMGCVLAVASAVLFWAGLAVAVFGFQLGQLALRLLTAKFAILLAVGLAAAWAYKWVTWE